MHKLYFDLYVVLSEDERRNLGNNSGISWKFIKVYLPFFNQLGRCYIEYRISGADWINWFWILKA